MRRFFAIVFLALLLNAAYLVALPSATVFYMANVLLHLVLGIAATAGFLWLLGNNRETLLATVLFALATSLGLYLTYSGATTPNRGALWLHVGFALLGSMALLLYLRRYPRFFQAGIAGVGLLLAGILIRQFNHPDDRIRNPHTVPLSMAEEGGGPGSPFWPSASRTNVGGIIPSNFFMDSKKCGECHKDIYEQWQGSMHHFASFNNQFYRKSIEYMQSIGGVQA